MHAAAEAAFFLVIILSLGPVAQSVEQRIENPCVGGSIPPQATKNPKLIKGLRILRESLFLRLNHALRFVEAIYCFYITKHYFLLSLLLI